MKLLAKSEIDTAKSADREREVREGMKIAKRVDALREVVVEEEAALNRFRTDTLSTIGEEIRLKDAERLSLFREVEELEGRRSKATESLDGEWANLQHARESVVNKERELSVLKQALDERDSRLNSKEAALDKKLDETELINSSLSSLRLELATMMSEAERKGREAEDRSFVLSTFAEKLNERERHLNEREKQLETAFTERSTELASEKAELGKQVLRLRDREQMLIRNTKRLNK